jgi:hypothetical protein
MGKNTISITTGATAGALAVSNPSAAQIHVLQVISTYPLDVVRSRMGALFGETRYTSIWTTLRVCLLRSPTTILGR